MRATFSFSLTWIAMALLLGRASAAEGAEFQRDVIPILQSRCVACHGPDKQRGGLRLDTAANLLRGGDSGAAVQAGKSKASPLLKRIASTDAAERMPPKGERLTPKEIAALTAWIDRGAKADADNAVVEEHWSFKPVVRPPLPKSADGKPPQNPIDRFILARLKQAKLAQSAEADRRTLIRRLAFDLTGLPPTPEQIEAFANDRSPLAYERLADRLLATPQFGERWARHWLDVVRFADSHGFEMNQTRPNAYFYRDYVIRAFNDDKPYDQFVREQLAGDSLGADAATGFLVAGPWDQVKSPDPVLTAQQRADELHDIVSTTGSAFLGLTVGCARCHAHKFDPIPQADYYAVKAVFAGVQHGERAISGRDTRFADANVVAAKPGALNITAFRPPVQTGKNIERFDPVDAKHLRFAIRTTNSGDQPCLDELEVFSAGERPQNVAPGAKITVSGTLPGYAIHKPQHLTEGQFGNGHSWISNEPGRGWVVLEFPATVRIDRVVWSRDRTEPPSYRDRIPTGYVIEVSLDGKAWTAVAGSADRGVSTGPLAYIGRLGTPEETFRFHRGEATQPKEKVGPGVLSTFSLNKSIPADATDAQRRLAFAEWATDPKHPLTARVIVNRLWQYHFGTGLVDTPSDFGKNGATPSHPELLDWLAAELVEHQWSLKHIHRLIVTSATYRQSSRSNPTALAADAQSRLLWRYPPRRLEAETIRDAVLAVSGKLDRTAGGPGFDLFEPNGNYVKVYAPKQIFGPDTFRRMIYQAKPRMQLDDTFGAFDCPDAGQIAPKRSRSTTPLQALNLFNSPFLLQQAGFFAERLKAEAGDNAVSQVKLGFVLAFGREPTMEEKSASLKLIEKFGVPAFTRALFNANEFVFIR